MQSGCRDLKGKDVNRHKDREGRGSGTSRGRGTQKDKDTFIGLSKGASEYDWDAHGGSSYSSRRLATGEVEFEVDEYIPETAYIEDYRIFDSASQGPSVTFLSTTDRRAENDGLENVQQANDDFQHLSSQELPETETICQDNDLMISTAHRAAYTTSTHPYSVLDYPTVPLLASNLANFSIHGVYNTTSETEIRSDIYDQPTGLDQLSSSSFSHQVTTSLDPAFQIISKPSRFYTVGRVFKLLWTEPAGTTSSEDKTFLHKLSNGQELFTKVRRFVVVKEMQGCCICLSLVTHNRQGATKVGANPANYAAVYEVGQTPHHRPGEVLQKNPFPIIIENASENVDPMSRLNFGRVYTIEHNLKVLKVGRIPTTHTLLLQRYFTETITSMHNLDVERTGPVVSQEGGLNMHPVSSHPRAGDLDLISEINDSLYFPYPADKSSQNFGVVAASSSNTSMPEDSLSDHSFPLQNYAGRHTRNFTQAAEKLDNHNFRVVSKKESKRFWKVGRVFMMLWTETATPNPRPTSATQSSHMSSTWLGGAAYTEIRRYVVLQEGYGCSYCAPILTYKMQATLRPNLPEVGQHAIIYTGENVPREEQYKAANGTTVRENLTKDPIRVVVEHPGKALVTTSRLNYSKIYTVEHNLPVLNIGIVHQGSMASLEQSSFVRRSEPPQGPIKRPPR